MKNTLLPANEPRFQ